jgi:hypothetical protein
VSTVTRIKSGLAGSPRQPARTTTSARARTIERTGARVFQAVWVVSAAFALLGAYHPWPPGYERKADRAAVWSMVTNPVGANLAAWMRAYAPDLSLTGWAGSAFISPEPDLRERYLSLFYRSRRWEEPLHR